MTKPIRPIRIEGNIAYVPLTKGYEATIGADDVYIVKDYNWYALVQDHTVYAVRQDNKSFKRSLVYMHRLIMGSPNGLLVDHKDSDGLNNTRNNLRASTYNQNNRNVRISKRNTSGFKGVYWDGQRKKWKAQIKLDGINLNLGRFNKIEDAYAAYCDASAELHGDFGRT